MSLWPIAVSRFIDLEIQEGEFVALSEEVYLATKLTEGLMLQVECCRRLFNEYSRKPAQESGRRERRGGQGEQATPDMVAARIRPPE